ncbi:MAG TPA: co-chaperone GroES [Verrucomicrobiales bacterium]|nr:co-chaperone GroES [Verrucomicrobiales bacterium]
MAADKVRPLGTRVLAQRLDAEEVATGGIIIPDTAKEKPQEAKVVALGTGQNEEGKDIPFTVKVGDKILISKYGGTEIKLDGTEYVIINESDILAVVEG